MKRVKLFICLMFISFSICISAYAQTQAEKYYSQAKEHQTLGIKLYAESKWNEAFKEYKEALTNVELIKKEYPDYFAGNKLSELEIELQTKFDNLESTLQTIVAAEYFNTGRLKEAEDLTVKILARYEPKYGAKFGTNAANLSRLASIYQIQGHYEKAIEMNNKFLSDYTHYRELCAMAVGEKMTIYLTMGKIEKAKEESEKLLSEYKGTQAAVLLGFFLEVMPLEEWMSLSKEKDVFLFIHDFLRHQISFDSFYNELANLNSKFEGLALSVIGLRYQFQSNKDINKAKSYYQKCLDKFPDKKDYGNKLAQAALRVIQ